VGINIKGWDMLSVAKIIKHSIFSNQHYSRLQKLLSWKSYIKHSKIENDTDSFIDIVLDADFDKHGKVIGLN
jgi:hypothetical protein